MSVFSGPVTKERVFPLMPTGEYAATLLDLTFESGGTYGDSLLWKWLLAPPNDPTAYIARDDGNEKTQHEYTPCDITLGSKSHEWIAALTGRVMEDGDDPPDAEELIGKRMLVYVTHQAPKQGPNAGKLRERFVQGSAKRLDGVLSRPVARGVVADPARASSENGDAERAELIEETKKQIRKATILDLEPAAQWAAIDLAGLTHQELRDGLQTIKDAIAAA